MELTELAFGVALVLASIGAATFFGWRQRRTLALLKKDEYPIPSSERNFLQGQVRRRTFCCVFLALFAAMLAAWLLFMEEHFRQLRPAEGGVIDEAAKNWVRFYTGYWIVALLVLLVIVGLAIADLLATAKYGLMRRRNLLREQQAMLAREAAKLRLRREKQ